MMTRRTFLSRAAATIAVGSRKLGAAEIKLNISNVFHEVAPGFVYRTTAYQEQVPAPVIRLREGLATTVEIFNQTALPEFVHWHGFATTPANDGTQEERSLSVSAHSSLRYDLTPQQAGVYWVHSHAHSHEMNGSKLDSGVYSGQYGMVSVETLQNPGRYDREFFLSMHEWGATRTWVPQSSEDDDDQTVPGPTKVPIAGSWEIEYDIGSINGKALGAGEPLRVRQGERVLFHLLNASATAAQRIALAGHNFLVVALDGHPVPRSQSRAVLELGVGERISAFVEMQNPGVWILGAVNDAERCDGRMGIVVEYSGQVGKPLWIPPIFQPWNYSPFAESTPQLELDDDQLLPMVIDRGAFDRNGMETWTVNGEVYDEKPYPLKAGRRYRLLFQNKTEEDHPLHLHRFPFEVTRIHGRAVGGLWKDVVVLERYAQLDVDFIPTECGLVLFHCHQQMHMEAGFKKLFEVR